MTAIEKYNTRAKAMNSLLCVGLDMDFSKIPEPFRSEEFPQFAFNKYIIETTHEYVSAYKPNTAFYESRGEAGFRELKMTIEYLQKYHSDIFLIDDAKRNEIGNTSSHYATSIFDVFGFDAVTLNPYLGEDALEPFLERKEKGCIILCRTSNLGSAEFQNLPVDGKPLWQVVLEKVKSEWNKNGNCMLVMGATHPEELGVARKLAGNMTFLVPGIGAQGGDLQKTVKVGINAENMGLIVNSSRGIIFSDNPGEAAKKLRDEINSFRTL